MPQLQHFFNKLHFLCDGCGLKTVSKELYTQHIAVGDCAKAPNRISKSGTILPGQPRKRYTAHIHDNVCKLCGAQLSGADELKLHIEFMHEDDDDD